MKKALLLICLLAGVTNLIHAQHEAFAGSAQAGINTIPGPDDALLSNRLDRDASFPGGNEALHAYVNKHFKYSEIAIENSIEGTILVQITLDKHGIITTSRVLNAVHPLLDQEALRVIGEMPVWEPRLKSGVAVPSRIDVPFAVRMQ